MAIDMDTLAKSVSRKKGLMDKLGDVKRFLKSFFASEEVSEAEVKKTISQLEQYCAAVFDQIESMGKEWHKTYRQIAELKQKMADAPPPVKNALVAEASIKLRAYDGFKARTDKLTRNGIAAQVLVEKLHDILLISTGPMTEDTIDEWTTALDEAIEERAMSDKALRELEAIGADKEPHSEISVEETESQLDRIAGEEGKSEEERAIEKRLEEF